MVLHMYMLSVTTIFKSSLRKMFPKIRYSSHHARLKQINEDARKLLQLDGTLSKRWLATYFNPMLKVAQ